MRLGYIIVKDDTHPLYDGSVRDRIKNYADSVSDEVIKLLAAIGPRVAFTIRQQPRGRSTPAKFLRELFVAEALDDVRTIYSDVSIESPLIASTFKQTPLLVIIEPRASGGIRISGISKQFPGCRIQCPEGMAEKVIEDVFIDIAVGHFRSQESPLSSVVRSEGLSSLFARKAQFLAKEGYPRGVLVEKDARYSPIAILSDRALPLKDRAARILEDWRKFEFTIIDVARTQVLATAGEARLPISAIPRIGGQLSVRRISKVAARHQPGEYQLIILTKSVSARKSEKIRNHVVNVFGKSARVNRAFILVGESDFTGASESLRLLSEGNFITTVRVSIAENQIWLR